MIKAQVVSISPTMSGSQQDSVITCPTDTVAVGPPVVYVKDGSNFVADPLLHYSLVPSRNAKDFITDFTVIYRGTSGYVLHVELTCFSY